MLDDEQSDDPSRSATLDVTRLVFMRTGPGAARDPPDGVDGRYSNFAIQSRITKGRNLFRVSDRRLALRSSLAT